jgi:hypothetical protein
LATRAASCGSNHHSETSRNPSLIGNAAQFFQSGERSTARRCHGLALPSALCGPCRNGAYRSPGSRFGPLKGNWREQPFAPRKRRLLPISRLVIVDRATWTQNALVGVNLADSHEVQFWQIDPGAPVGKRVHSYEAVRPASFPCGFGASQVEIRSRAFYIDLRVCGQRGLAANPTGSSLASAQLRPMTILLFLLAKPIEIHGTGELSVFIARPGDAVGK